MKTNRSTVVIIILLYLILLNFAQLYSNDNKEDLLFKANSKSLYIASREIENQLKYKDAFISKFRKGWTELHFIAASHSNDPESLTFKTIDYEFEEFNPDVIIVEKENSEMGISPEEVKKRYLNNKDQIIGESDYALYLAVNNKNKWNKIDFLLAEPTTEFVLEHIKKYSINDKKLTEKDVLFFYIVRVTKEYVQSKKITSNQQLKQEFLNILKEIIIKYNFNKSFNKLTFNDFNNWYYDIMGNKIDYENFFNLSLLKNDNISKFNKYISYICDINIVENIEKIVNIYSNILIIYSSSHYARIKPVLIKMFGKNPEEVQILDNNKVKNIYKLIQEKVNKRYNAWIKDKDEYPIMYYGDIENFNELKNSKRSLASAWSHFIYYNNITKKRNLYSIILLGKYYGDQENIFYFTVQDIKGKVLFKSKEYKYSEFSKDKFEYKEFIVNIKNIPKDFFIEVKTSSTRYSGVFFISIPSSKNVYSFQYMNPEKYKEYKKENVAIFPKFN
jgi:hypothetical protein